MAKVKTAQQSGSGAIPAYMPSQYNYESMQKQSRGMVRMDELDAEDPARYDEPTQSELDRSQPIPRDMVRRAREAGAGGNLDDDSSDDDASIGRNGCYFLHINKY